MKCELHAHTYTDGHVFCLWQIDDKGRLQYIASDTTRGNDFLLIRQILKEKGEKLDPDLKIVEIDHTDKE